MFIFKKYDVIVFILFMHIAPIYWIEILQIGIPIRISSTINHY